ncbi:MAG TPA: hypothetical protein VE974_20590 [Thermoanaerobaculia bacterium]|nr:hypothetical protein [Thermoanaerobaculia bacterium]
MFDVLGTLLDYALVFVREWFVLLAVVAAAWFAPWRPRGVGCRVSGVFRLGVIVFCVSLFWSLGVVAFNGIPRPLIHDDYAVLLGGEMFANGRASYPTHPLWPHLESFHVLQVPSYASKYPLGNELVLAFGLRLSGIALLGSWLVAAAACAAIFWALLPALPPWWAFAGGVAAAIHPLMLNWSESYRGGGLAALGGALLFGAALRIAHEPRVRDGAIAGAGLALLAVSRPYEGLILAAACAIAVHRVHFRTMLAAVAVASLGLLAIAAHNRAVTGSFTTLPWTVYARQYDSAPQFVWQADRPVPQYRNEEFRFVWERMHRRSYERMLEPGGLRDELLRRVDFIATMVVNDPENRRPALLFPLFLVPFLLLPFVLREDRNARIAAAVVAIGLLAPFTIWVFRLTHYLAPLAAPVAALMLLLVRRLAATPRGQRFAIAIAIVFAVNAAMTLSWWSKRAEGMEPVRQRLVQQAGGGKHLFIVAPDAHGLVYNGADIDAARVVWARDLGDNRALLAYFKDRKQWRVEKSGLHQFGVR